MNNIELINKLGEEIKMLDLLRKKLVDLDFLIPIIKYGEEDLKIYNKVHKYKLTENEYKKIIRWLNNGN